MDCTACHRCSIVFLHSTGIVSNLQEFNGWPLEYAIKFKCIYIQSLGYKTLLCLRGTCMMSRSTCCCVVLSSEDAKHFTFGDNGDDCVHAARTHYTMFLLTYTYIFLAHKHVHYLLFSDSIVQAKCTCPAPPGLSEIFFGMLVELFV